MADYLVSATANAYLDGWTSATPTTDVDYGTVYAAVWDDGTWPTAADVISPVGAVGSASQAVTAVGEQPPISIAIDYDAQPARVLAVVWESGGTESAVIEYRVVVAYAKLSHGLPNVVVGDSVVANCLSNLAEGDVYYYAKSTPYTGSETDRVLEIISNGVKQPASLSNTISVAGLDPLTMYYAGWTQNVGTAQDPLYSSPLLSTFETTGMTSNLLPFQFNTLAVTLDNEDHIETGDGAILTCDSTSDAGTIYVYSKTTPFSGSESEKAAEIMANGLSQQAELNNTITVTGQDPLTPHYAGWVQDYGAGLSLVLLDSYTTLDLPVAPVQTKQYPDLVSRVGTPVNYNLGSSYWSSNAGAMTYREVGLPGGLAMDVNTGRVTGTPNTNSTAQVDIYAANIEGESGPGEFQWTVVLPGVSIPNDEKTLSDARFRSLRDQGFQGATNDMLLQWAQAHGGTGSLNDALLYALNVIGAGTYYTLTDAWRETLWGMGFNGTRNDMELEFWRQSGAPSLRLEVLAYYLGTKGWNADILQNGKLRIKLQGQPNVKVTLQELIDYIYQNLPGIPSALVADIDYWRG